MGLLSTIGAASGRAFGLTRVGAAIRDAYFNLTTLLLPGNGTNGAQNNTFLDSSTNNFTITRNGNTTQGTFSPFSQTGWSNFFNASSELNAGSNSAFSFGTGAYTVEMWVFPVVASTSYGAGTGPCLFFNDNTGGFGFWNPSGSGLEITTRAGSSILTSTTHLVTNQWNHVVAVRSGTSTNQTSIFLNGSRIANGTDATNWTVTGPAKIGGISLTNYYLNGYASNVRVVKGTAVYDPTQTTLTVPTSPLTAITNTSLLTCQSNRFIDNSANAFSITTAGTPSVQSFSPFAPTAAYDAATVGGSGYFDGTGDFLDTPSNAAFGFGTGDATIEAWIYPTTVSGTQVFVETRVGTAAGIGFYLSGATLSVARDSATVLMQGGTVTANAWNYVVWSRIGSTNRLFLNGTETTSVTNSTSYPTAKCTIGNSDGGTQFFNGYISSVRVVKGSGVSSVTVPTAPLTNITNTSLLLNYTNAGITDATAKNDLETVGNAQISTTQSKFGGSSMYFDGTGDWLLMPHTVDQMFGTGAFTVEFWLYLGATGAARGLVAKGTSTTGWLVSLDSSNRVVFTYTTSTITSTGAISGTTWTHIAVVREGTGTNQTKIYINGTNDGTGTVSTDFNQTSVMYVGANRTGGDALNGYIDDLRVTRGYARYTSNFTAPTAAFALQ